MTGLEVPAPDRRPADALQQVPAPRPAPPAGRGEAVPPGAEPEAVYGLLRLAGVDAALPLDVLREVVLCPVDLAPLPADAAGLLGGMNLRGAVLPVVDLRPAIGRTGGRSAEQVAVVVARDGRAVGLLADEVRGVIRLAGSALAPVATTGGRLLFSHAFQHPDDGSVVSLLDADAVLRTPGVPTVADMTRETGALDCAGRTPAARTGGAARAFTLLRCGPHLLALDIAQVHTTVPPPHIRPSVIDSPLCQGVTNFAGRDVPVVDTLALVGLGAMELDEIGAGLVLDLGHGYVILALGELLDLIQVRADDLLPLPALADSRLLAAAADLQRTSAAVSDTVSGSCLVIDGEALVALPELIGLASVNTAADGTTLPGTTSTPATSVAAATGPAYLVYTAGADMVTPLDRVQEILPFPAEITSAPGIDGMLGLVVHRQKAVPVLVLADLLGRGGRPVGPSSCLLLVSVDEEVVAFAVDRLRGIEQLAWADQDHAGAAHPSRDGVLASARLVQAGSEPRLLPELDLTSLARSLRVPQRG